MSKIRLEGVKITLPKEKAKELVCSYMFDRTDGNTFLIAKECAYIAIGEIISVCPYISKSNADTTEQLRADNIMFVDFWQQVEKEVKAL